MISERDAGMMEMEALLLRAASAMPYPETPSLARAVEERLRAQERTTGRSFWPKMPRQQVAGAFAAAIIAIVAVVLVVPASRTALAEFFGLSNVRVKVEPLPTSLPTVAPEDVARSVSFEELRTAVDFPVQRLPGEAPNGVFVLGDDPSTAVAILSYEDLGFDLYQSRGAFFGKGLPDESFIHEVQVNGRSGLWIEPGHSALFEGSGLPSLRRLIDRGVLFWQKGEITLRLETSLSQQEAIEVADAVR